MNLQDTLTAYHTALLQAGFQGDIETTYGQRIVAATDNSVYQVLPLMIIFPRVLEDMDRAVHSLRVDTCKYLSLTARGGNTGTNGQSLNSSIILDTSRYLNRIIELNIEQKTVTVEPGVVLDQLNQVLRKHGLFFPPNVSTASRATLGGMVATDASGKGSRIYGKTSDYIEQLESLMADGSTQVFRSAAITAHPLYQALHACVSPFRDTIEQVFPKMNRGLTGYNLKQLLGPVKSAPTAPPLLYPTYLLAGSEGTLALSKRITLRVLPLPKHTCLVAVFYADFLAALRHVQHLLAINPTAIEVLDDNILKQAQQDVAWQDLKQILGGTLEQLPATAVVRGINFIELQAATAEQLAQKCQQLQQHMAGSAVADQVLAWHTETDTQAMAALWSLRARSVGLLGALEGERRAVAFVEDTAVPPECLADFMSEFRDLLDGYGLQYGMFGHADVGCLHVRPTLDLQKTADQQLFRTLSDQVAQLTRRYGGLLWGEHGRGYRGEYSPLFFGEELYPLLVKIKVLFDPDNRFNPGKLAAPEGEKGITAIDAIPFRGQLDGQIAPEQRVYYRSAIRCNGNGQCFSVAVQEAMCPSYKATGNKSLSPKGRAALLREWLRLQNSPPQAGMSADKHPVMPDLERSLYDSLSQCLSCKSCTHSCPVKVDIPELKSRFLEQYHEKEQRPRSDYALLFFEKMAYWGRRFPALSNALLHQPRLQGFLEKHLGMVNVPFFSKALPRGRVSHAVHYLNHKQLVNLPAASLISPINVIPAPVTKPVLSDHSLDSSLDNLPDNPLFHSPVLLLPDSFNASFDSPLIVAAAELLAALGIPVRVAPVLENGKALHVKGFRRAFARTARQHTRILSGLADKGYTLLSLDVVTRLMHEQEYADYHKQKDEPDTDEHYTVYSLEHWLYQQRAVIVPRLKYLATRKQRLSDPQPAQNPIDSGLPTPLAPLLLPHCMEQTKDKSSARYWQALFEAADLPLQIQNQGCCGMAGSFGHEARHHLLAEQIYHTHWQTVVKQAQQENRPLLASGFSCRCQLQIHGQNSLHPLVWLWQHLQPVSCTA